MPRTCRLPHRVVRNHLRGFLQRGLVCRRRHHEIVRQLHPHLGELSQELLVGEQPRFAQNYVGIQRLLSALEAVFLPQEKRAVDIGGLGEASAAADDIREFLRTACQHVRSRAGDLPGYVNNVRRAHVSIDRRNRDHISVLQNGVFLTGPKQVVQLDPGYLAVSVRFAARDLHCLPGFRQQASAGKNQVRTCILSDRVYRPGLCTAPSIRTVRCCHFTSLLV